MWTINDSLRMWKFWHGTIHHVIFHLSCLSMPPTELNHTHPSNTDHFALSSNLRNPNNSISNNVLTVAIIFLKLSNEVTIGSNCPIQQNTITTTTTTTTTGNTRKNQWIFGFCQKNALVLCTIEVTSPTFHPIVYHKLSTMKKCKLGWYGANIYDAIEPYFFSHTWEILSDFGIGARVCSNQYNFVTHSHWLSLTLL